VTVCVTNNDEKNLLCSLLVKQLGCKRIITRVGNLRNSMLFERVGIDVVVSRVTRPCASCSTGCRPRT
jgi:K+ transport systems, NAD-binding component